MNDPSAVSSFEIDLQDVDYLVACSRITNKPNGYGGEGLDEPFAPKRD